MKFILSYLLHYANRTTKDKEFYTIKDQLLKKYGEQLGHDIQHIPGKRCNGCDNGDYVKYSMYPPYKAYAVETCWYCNGTGYYKMPQWNCLSVVRFGPFTFHRPLKRELCIKNPCTKEGMGFDVSERPVIEGYIDHNEPRFGIIAVLILYYLYDRTTFKTDYKYQKSQLKWRFKRLIPKFRLEDFILEKPVRFVKHWVDASGREHKVDPDLPF